MKKLQVYQDQDGILAYHEKGQPAPYGFRLHYLGDVDVEPVGVIWGTPDDVSRELRSRVEAAATAAGLI